MKALTIQQPFATLIAIGAKRIETRSWSTNHRGPIAIHCSSNFPKGYEHLCLDGPFIKALTAGKVSNGDLHDQRGKIVATANLCAVERVGNFNVPGGQEFEFGNFEHGRYMWYLKDVKRLAAPVAMKGTQGLWEFQESEFDLTTV
jgi:hypothetical protein